MHDKNTKMISLINLLSEWRWCCGSNVGRLPERFHTVYLSVYVRNRENKLLWINFHGLYIYESVFVWYLVRWTFLSLRHIRLFLIAHRFNCAKLAHQFWISYHPPTGEFTFANAFCDRKTFNKDNIMFFYRNIPIDLRVGRYI